MRASKRLHSSSASRPKNLCDNSDSVSFRGRPGDLGMTSRRLLFTQTLKPRRWVLCWALPACLFGCAIALAAGNPSARQHWEVRGEMSEACTCEVPCPCNFGQGPAPQHYCWSLASFYIEKGHYGSVKLDGLHLVRAHGERSTVWYIDETATAAQAAALRSLVGIAAHGASRRPEHFERARIVQTAPRARFKLAIGDKGGFTADEIIGMDGKNPVVVENMTAWNVQHDIKGKTVSWKYTDEFGNHFDLNGTNANLGRFDWTEKTPNPF